jgi:alpha-beta hydrolase superfamily lysophospholipase
MRLWQAERPGPLAIHLHGIEGHSRWFESTALALRQAGISTCAIDRRGAGKSGGTAGDVSSYRRLVDDVEELLPQLLTLKQIQPTALFLIGNCWGAKVAVVAATNGRLPSLSGFIVTSPAWVTQVDASLFTKLKIGLNYLFGGRGCFDIPLTPQHFTDNPPYLSYVSADQLRLKQATARFFVESLKLTRACRRDLPKLTMPVLILQSGRDAIVDLKGIDQWFSFVGSGDKTLKIFTSAAHSLDFEADQAQYQECLSSWIQSRASARGTAVAS